MIDLQPAGTYFPLTPPALCVAGLRAAISMEIPNLSFVFDPDLSWPTAMQERRDMADMEEGSGEAASIPDQAAADAPTQFPLMSWSRSVLKPMDGITRRNTRSSFSMKDVSGEDWAIQAFWGSLEFNFKIFARDVMELEAIEIGYVAKSLIQDITGFRIPVDSLFPSTDVSGIPPSLWHYDVQWNPLDTLEVTNTPTMLFAISGSALIRGAFVTGLVTPQYPIRTANLSVFNYDQSQLDASIVVTKLQR